MKLVVCNTEWATGKKKKLLNEIIFDYSPDIVCATEVKKDFFLKEGNVNRNSFNRPCSCKKI